MIDGQPNIVEVVSGYIELKRRGKEFVGLCLLHEEKTPSFTVNEEKGLFYCHGCGEGGDAIRFIEKIEGLGFKDALAYLGAESPPRRTQEDQGMGDESERIVAWAASVGEQIGEKLRDIGQAQRLTSEFPDKKLAAWERGSLQRQWEILVVIDDDLADPECMVELYKNRDVIEGLLTL